MATGSTTTQISPNSDPNSYLTQKELYTTAKNGSKVPIPGYELGKDGIVVPIDPNSYNIGKDGVIIPKPGYSIGKNGLIVKNTNSSCDPPSQGYASWGNIMTDSQLKPGFTSPPVCPQGCARWDNLAADGNTQNQAYVNAKWTGGAPPPGAGNMCAMPGSDDIKADGPWCYCAGTNNQDWGYCQERNSGAETCKKTPNSLNKINTELNDCTSTTELKRNTSFATTTFKIQKDIETLRGIIGDTMSMGDTMFGQFSYGDIMKQVKARNTELKSKKETLVNDVEKKEAIIQRTDRDFSDVNDSIPKPMRKRVLNFVEDYTLAILAISYLFMILSIMYVYTATADLKLIAFGKVLVGSGFLTLFLFMLLFYLA